MVLIIAYICAVRELAVYASTKRMRAIARINHYNPHVLRNLSNLCQNVCVSMHRKYALSFFLTVGALGACRSDVDHWVNPKPGVEIETASTNVPQMGDIPLPKGFQLQNDRLQSYVVESAGFRTGRQLFIGTARPIDVVRYFDERLPQHGWVPAISWTVKEPSTMSVWRKGDTAVRIELGLNDSEKTSLSLRIGTSRDPNYVP